MAAQVPLIWITGAVVLAVLIAIAAIFVKVYQDRRDRDAFVTIVCIFAITSLLATVCLFPVDIALVSTTTDNSTGRKKDWATPETVRHILLSLEIVYYLLYSLDAVLALLVIPFAYFWYEEWDQDTTARKRFKGALKYSLFFLALVVVLFLVGFFVPAARQTKGHLNLDYFRRLLTENHGERALTFCIGVLICLGTVAWIVYTAPGLALLPAILIRSSPSSSLPAQAVGTQEQLAINRERQRAIEVKNSGQRPNSKDRRELESLQRAERTLVRRQRVAEASASSHSKRLYLKLQAIGRPFKILFGLFILGIGILIFASMLITGIDKSQNSTCGKRCGFILPNPTILNPLNGVFVAASAVFPVDYVLALTLVFLFFVSSVIGLSAVGIRFLWVSLFRLRVSSTKPQGLLVATVLLTLITLALNYALTMVLLPGYSHYGNQRYYDKTTRQTNKCDERAPQDICTPTIVSTFINRVTLNFPFFGAFAFWAQFVFLAIWLVVTLTSLVWVPKTGGEGDEEEEEEEEESLLAATSRRTEAAWEDLTGRARRNGDYGAVGRDDPEAS